jgi:hypothetical protein
VNSEHISDRAPVQREAARVFTHVRTDGDDLLRRSSFYREYLAEREEILRHKWYESEKAGRDIGFEHALTDWVLRHRAHWVRARRAGRN